jgi:hypothetical protein
VTWYIEEVVFLELMLLGGMQTTLVQLKLLFLFFVCSIRPLLLIDNVDMKCHDVSHFRDHAPLSQTF